MKESWTDMFIGCTGKAAKYLHSSIVDMPSQVDLMYCWQVTHFSVLGDEILLFMNVHTRFPLFMRDKEGLTVASLQQRFTYLFTRVMDALNIPKEAIDFYLCNQQFSYGKILDRSVMSQMNDLAYIYKFNVMNGAHNYYYDADASIHYANIPCIKANMYPKEKMLEAMNQFYLLEKEVS